jgi:hypothetical protein
LTVHELAHLITSVGALLTAFAMTAASLWVGGRLAPWFLSEAVEAPSVRTLLLSATASADFFRVRVAACLLAAVVMLAGLLAILITARLLGWSPAA